MKLVDANGKEYRGKISVKVVLGTTVLWLVLCVIIFFGTCEISQTFLIKDAVNLGKYVVSFITEMVSEDFVNEGGDFDYNSVVKSLMVSRLKRAVLCDEISNAYVLGKNPDGSFSLIWGYEDEPSVEEESINSTIGKSNPYKGEGMKIIQKYSGSPDIFVEYNDREGYFILSDKETGEFSYSAFATIKRSDLFLDEKDNEELIGLLVVDMNYSMVYANSFLLSVFIFLLLIIMIIAFMLMYFAFAYYAISRPIKRLAIAASEASKQSEESGKITAFGEMQIKGNDEIAYYTSIMQSMEKSINDFADKKEKMMKEKEYMEASLNIANQIQDSQLLKDFPVNPAFDAYASMHPAREVGGDFYDCVLLDEDHLYICVADVSDKGIPAALFMMMAKIHLLHMVNQCYSPKKVLYDVNNILCENNQDVGMFVTIWIGILDLKTGEMLCGNAGHENPVIKKFSGKYEEIHDEHDCVVSAFPDMEYNEYKIQLDRGDVLFLYTDGLPEAKNCEDEMYGMDRIISELNSVPEDYNAKEIDEFITGKVAAFRGEAERFDDITILTLKYNGK